MAKPIELGLELTGEDALRFHQYMEHPTIPDRGMALIREAVRQSNKEKDRV
ncbi:MAG: hypothetical protein NTV68_09880 [Methanomicrobiales archaeon]|nr:hypothetical protein [Methanomicrobiales archaeon]